MVATMEHPRSSTITPELRTTFQSWLEGLMTHSDLCRLFKRSELTVMLWRQNHGLPYIRVPGENRDTIRYDREQVIAWARSKGKRLHLDPSKV
jgi:hypothetical protein